VDSIADGAHIVESRTSTRPVVLDASEGRNAVSETVLAKKVVDHAKDAHHFPATHFCKAMNA